VPFYKRRFWVAIQKLNLEYLPRNSSAQSQLRQEHLPDHADRFKTDEDEMSICCVKKLCFLMKKTHCQEFTKTKTTMIASLPISVFAKRTRLVQKLDRHSFFILFFPKMVLCPFYFWFSTSAFTIGLWFPTLYYFFPARTLVWLTLLSWILIVCWTGHSPAGNLILLLM
jgi:hypothetical protein